MGANKGNPDLRFGLYRGVVADIDDPEQRNRYRVRVNNVHPDELATEHLPWAETAIFGGKSFGDIPFYDEGDPVLVVFEQGNRKYPVVMAGWVSKSGGVPDLPAEQTDDYARSQQRWIRYDRAGNKIEMSPLSEEQYILIQSGGGIIAVRANDGTVEITAEAQCVINAPTTKVNSREVTLTAENVMAQIAGKTSLIGGKQVDIQAADVINIGRYEDDVLGAAAPRQCDLVDVRANENVKIESGGNPTDPPGTSGAGTMDIDAQGDLDVDTEADAHIRAKNNMEVLVDDGDLDATIGTDMTINVGANAEVNIGGNAEVAVDGTADIRVSGKTTVVCENDLDATVQNNMSASVTRDCSVSVGGKTSVSSTGDIELSSSRNVKISAGLSLELSAGIKLSQSCAQFELAASAVAQIDGGSLCQIDASLIRIA